MRGATRALTEPGSRITSFIRHDAPDERQAVRAVLVLVNPDLANGHDIDVGIDPVDPFSGAALGNARTISGGDDTTAPLAPGEVRVVEVERLRPITRRRRPGQELDAALQAPRVVIEAVTPAVDAGRFAAKRLSGERVTVAADIFIDGHGVIVAELLWRCADETGWRRVPMRRGDNDRWQATFAPGRIGRHWFTVEAWADDFASLCRDIEVKQRAGADVAREIEEVRDLVETTATAAGPQVKAALARALDAMATASASQAIDILFAPDTALAMRAAMEHRFSTRHASLPLDVDRPAAGFASWYEMFPRSAAATPGRHGTFADVIARLPDIRAMGFDVLYLAADPSDRAYQPQRPQQRPAAAPDDPGSPYAIGAEEVATTPSIRNSERFEDFRRLVARRGRARHRDRARLRHPMLAGSSLATSSIREWFRWRPDGSMRFAENPPKKYEDIVNVEFYADGAASALWTALRDIVLFWIGHGVRIFRVDNPHTKPLPFWEWMIADVRARHPTCSFFPRPSPGRR